MTCAPPPALGIHSDSTKHQPHSYGCCNEHTVRNIATINIAVTRTIITAVVIVFYSNLFRKSACRNTTYCRTKHDINSTTTKYFDVQRQIMATRALLLEVYRYILYRTPGKTRKTIHYINLQADLSKSGLRGIHATMTTMTAVEIVQSRY